jgi:hypothetical protein
MHHGEGGNADYQAYHILCCYFQCSVLNRIPVIRNLGAAHLFFN